MADRQMRYELKYIISRPLAMFLSGELKKYMQLDPHARADGSYFIRSLYFDNMCASAYRDKLDGVEKRAKYRIRFYNHDPSFVCFEKKEKIRDMTCKTACRIRAEEAVCMAEHAEVPDRDDPLLREFRAACIAGSRARVLVDYDRYIFIHPVGNTRITLDLDVRTTPFETDLFARDLASLPVLSPGEAILEVKYTDVFPTHIGRLLETFPKDRSAVSKYCRCLSVIE